ncbi:uncharacterized protein M421DRAFT_4988 [Didymella exigua CBS 183.55]|uniref:Uncharacterized protein n=1 Tax=Didymella exigua CBS 183.55 TaxID=1150837 RepID=A0A6A5RQD2_9PLEO|nr:uncharacterized protein M421DRAFT_4988 [Didymella exigua CBS 183.55]KAF1928516.1 hypothetical protein M421DRAFT_4988 [Didymella exigua CBS 183.55]
MAYPTAAHHPTEVPNLLHDRDTITEANQTNSPLLRLPAELRYKIYALAAGQNVEFGYNHDDEEFYVVKTPSPFLLLCRQTYNETRNDKAQLVLQPSEYAGAFLTGELLGLFGIDTHCVHTIKFPAHVTLCMMEDSTGAEWAFACLEGFTGVERIEFQVPEGMGTSLLEESTLWWRTSFDNDDMQVVVRRPPKSL